MIQFQQVEEAFLNMAWSPNGRNIKLADTDFKALKDFNTYPIELQKSIMKEMVAERKDPQIYSILIKEYYPSDLPCSIDEHLTLQYLHAIHTKSPGYDTEIVFGNWKSRLFDIRTLEQKILTKGYRSDSYITLQLADLDDNLTVNGGNRRLQAVRNLIKKRRLPVDFTIPCIIIVDGFQQFFRNPDEVLTNLIKNIR